MSQYLEKYERYQEGQVLWEIDGLSSLGWKSSKIWTYILRLSTHFWTWIGTQLWWSLGCSAHLISSRPDPKVSSIRTDQSPCCAHQRSVQKTINTTIKPACSAIQVLGRLTRVTGLLTLLSRPSLWHKISRQDCIHETSMIN